MRELVAVPYLSGGARVGWWLLLAWLVVRFVLLGIEVAWQPLYPWDAWTQWATKARVWYELGRIVPFAGADAWFAGDGAVYFDAAPGYPPTVPLLQAWTCLALGRWDDTLMNWPWWQIAVALALAVYGGLRSLARAGAGRVSSARSSSRRCRSRTCMSRSPVTPTFRWRRSTRRRSWRSCAGTIAATRAKPSSPFCSPSRARRSRIRAFSGR